LKQELTETRKLNMQLVSDLGKGVAVKAVEDMKKELSKLRKENKELKEYIEGLKTYDC
jgi:DNA-binding transcriptional regulator GbsR (MarR family)